ncbi:MAG: CDP-diacylglycerol--serine O-phosphatidyltransferase [Puniceicoccaceae bacterium]|jgi:CDP-diacylglycerol---serine O-phosphatidyltransferase|nr:CDP-diacylglycerol--serine O-phosphatidyltransferase [Puniceicoccaceae bacterium]MBL6838302.1 CDP-diacylglycerol--serine O-phosphatidyltransferase [Puniceicoccaceae bacterium]MBL6912069.1 CDP-diacylglycerol--serine O-phosphatidyltransferase [Puniceicoccaceae bacterium]
MTEPNEVTEKARHQYADSGEASHIYLLPNSLTAGNLFFGFLAILRCIQANYATDPELISSHFTQAVWFILFSVICDALDGRVARLGGRESLFGKEFDSIADVVSFGVAPSLMMIFLILQPTEKYPFFLQFGWLIAFVYLLCAAVRLARFNVLTHPMLPLAERLKGTKDFLGLPVPAAAGMIASLVLVLNSLDLRVLAILLPPLMLAIAGLMVSNIPYPSFKDIDWQTSTRFRTFIYLIFGLAIIFIIKELAFALLFLSYIAYGPIRHLIRIYRAKKRLKNSGE